MLQFRLKIISGTLCLFAFLALFRTNPLALAREEYAERVMTRGEVVQRIVDAFNIGQREESFLGACREQPHECFFVFSAMSDYDDISFEPFFRLYPDVNEKSRYYEAITTASMLGLVHGYLHEEDTPFKPEVVMTRIQALKIALGASDLMGWKDHFELSEEELTMSTPYVDMALSTPENWWYKRYLNFANETGIIPDDEFFRPDDPVTFEELEEILDNTRAYLEARRYDTKTVARGNTAE